MKILFTSDWHIKLGQKNVPIEWAKNRYNLFIEQLVKFAKNVDILVIGGDVFDRVPSLEELSIFFDIVRRLPVSTIIYPSNHEATKKGKSFLSVLKPVMPLLNPKVSIIDSVTEYEWGTILPYCNLFEKGVFSELNPSIPLYTHVRAEIPPHVKPEIDLTLLDKFPIVFAGDLHSHSNSQRNIVYPGSPMTTSFHRTEVDTGFLYINDCTYEWVAFDLPQLIRKTVQNPKEMVPTSPNHTIYELEGDISQLSAVKNTDLLDKKVVRRKTETALILSKDMTIEEELFEYLCYILELPEDVASSIIKEFHDNI